MVVGRAGDGGGKSRWRWWEEQVELEGRAGGVGRKSRWSWKEE